MLPFVLGFSHFPSQAAGQHRTRLSLHLCSCRPVWRSTKSGLCPSVCEASGHRAALEDSTGTGKHICRPEPGKGRQTTLVGWAAFENAGPGRVGNACHYVAQQVGRHC